MKLIDNVFIQVNAPAGSSTWRYIIPSNSITLLNKNQFYRIFLKKMVYKNDFCTINSNTNTIIIDGTTTTLRTGSPSASLLAKELNLITPNITFSFDQYDGKMYVTNNGSVPSTISPELSCSSAESPSWMELRRLRSLDCWIWSLKFDVTVTSSGELTKYIRFC